MINIKNTKICTLLSLSILMLVASVSTEAAINLDRTRIVLNSDQKSISIQLTNQSNKLPYLAQSWLENDKGEKIDEPLVALPPMQRVSAGKKSQVRILQLPSVKSLPKDRESLFYFNVREIPPNSELPNVMQIAIQSRVKLFYRPKEITNNFGDIWQEKLKISKINNGIKISNPTAYYVTLGYLSKDYKGNFPGFDSVMIAPFSSEEVKIPSYNGNVYDVGYMDDFGGLTVREYRCVNQQCNMQSVNEKK